MNETESVVAVYESHTEAEAAIRELGRSGFNMRNLSIVGKEVDTEEHVVGYYNAGDRMKYWGATGAFWGAGLYSLGIPKDTVLQYETAVKSNKFLVIAHGTPDELAKAKRVMHTECLVTSR